MGQHRSEADSFPRLSARTQRFTLGAPRSFTVAAGGVEVLFLRSPGPTDPTTALWVLDVSSSEERLLVAPGELVAGGAAGLRLTTAERRRRERARESAGGITSYATDSAGRMVAFAFGGGLYTVDVATGGVTAEQTSGAAFDPRPDPTGRRVAYATAGALRVVERGGADREVVSEPGVAWGVAEFVAAEEMGRSRGFWWSPDGSRLLAARVDERGVQTWWIADPAHPDAQPVEQRYPAAGTPNADVSLWLVDLDGTRTEVVWDRVAFEYVVDATWSEQGLLVTVQSRDQRTVRVLLVDERTGRTSLRRELRDPHWVDIVEGAPAWTDSGRVVTVAPQGDTHRLWLDDVAVTPDGLQVAAVLSVDGERVLIAATGDPTEQHVWEWSPGGLRRLSEEAGVHSGRQRDGTLVLTSAALDRHGSRTQVRRADSVTTLTSRAATPSLEPRVTLLRAGALQIRTALLLPTGHRPGSSRLPVLLDPYGGPHAQRVVAARSAYLTSQWLADQGFAVVVADGRGTPSRGPAWERAIAEDWADAVLEDQVTALQATAEECADLDLSRVAMRGWSYGGYLAALAVLRRPDVFHAGVAGAPVTDWALYDTHYTERYLGVDPHGADAARYAAESLLGDAPALSRPLLLIHGLADDNVVAAHTLRLSAALLAAGRPHEVLPLSGVTHMTPQEEVAENLLLLQVDFLRRAFGR